MKEKPMKKAEAEAEAEEMLDEYDFSKGVRGKYAARAQKGTNIIVLDPDVAKVFPDTAAVNNALRALAGIIKENQRQTPAKRKS